jgi:hypothetical protein
MQMIHLTKLITNAYREDEGDQVKVAPVTINVAAIRCFNPRKENQPGTRITFTDGGGYAVQEGYADVLRYITTGEKPEARPPLSVVTPSNGDTVN